MGPGSVARGVFREQRCKTQRFLAEFLTNQLLAARSFVTLVEKQVERLQDPIQS